ncbi:hypothetical protein RIF29_40952 [Crotalaria pallida]|uniref:Uncharacterized protein n=1 Tax=Crotalaria pallida TaxID=3830 RepID=A0AAN9HUS4_CROPI
MSCLPRVTILFRYWTLQYWRGSTLIFIYDYNAKNAIKARPSLLSFFPLTAIVTDDPLFSVHTISLTISVDKCCY